MKYWAILFATFFIGIAPAAAQQSDFYPAPANQAVSPPTQPFVQLPPSRSCTANDVQGLWKLVKVYESPIGLQTSAFVSNSVQFMLFNADSTYGKYVGSAELALPVVRGEIAKQSSGLQQFVVDGSGIVFFYQDQISTDSLACFIVVNQVGIFAPGEMLLMPPEGTIQGRLVKVYVKINENLPPPRRGRR